MDNNSQIATIFISGVHGVGKSKFCQTLDSIINADSVSASDIIKESNQLRKNKTVDDIDNNQDLLVEGLTRLETNKCYLLLDGHFCLLQEDYRIENVPISTFQDIRLIGIILLKCDPGIICKRIIQRDNQESWNAEFIRKFQDQETARAFEVAKKLKIPIVQYNTETSLSTTEGKQLIYKLGIQP